MNKTLHIDSTYCDTELDRLGAKFFTDKSPFNPGDGKLSARKGFTAVYTMIFSVLKNKEINFCELGVENGASVQMWENYFVNANLFAFEIDRDKIEKSKLLTKRTKFFETDVGNEEILNRTFLETGVLFDVIIDDSSHHHPHQLNIIKTASKYLKSGGILIIEDCYRTDPEDKFDSAISEEFIFNTFIICHHNNRSGHDNDKIWYAVKK